MRRTGSAKVVDGTTHPLRLMCNG